MAARPTTLGTDSSAGARLAEIQAHRNEILEQMGKLLASPLFKSSRHYPALLRYVVEQTLDGHAPLLKERALGIAVFGRDPAYDTNLDPVVRTSACEVRKRIAMYYHEAGRETELRIDLPSGSYVADFHFPQAAPAPAIPVLVAAAPKVSAAGTGWLIVARFARAIAGAARSRRVLTACVIAIPLALGVAAAGLRASKSSVEQFWGPVWNSSDSIIVCLGGSPGLELAQEALAAQPGPTGTVPSANQIMRLDRIAYSDALTLARIVAVIREHKKKFDVRRRTALTLTDLRHGPAVLIGAFNNEWTLRLKKDLRFTFERESEHGPMLIRDGQHPSARVWRVDASQPFTKIIEDYAIVSRVIDPLTEKIVVTVAGMTKDGTLAAGEFVTEEKYMDGLVARAPRGWERKNVQAVLATELVNDVPGPPRILDAYFW